MNHTAHILGTGGIGIAAGVCLARAGWNVTMVDSNAKKIEAGKRDGMSVDGQIETRAHFVSFQKWAPPANETILLCVKTFDNASVLQRIANMEHVVPIQNGFDAQLELLHHPAEAIASFVSECDADCPATRITRAGSLHIGARYDINAAQQECIDTLANALAQGKLFPVENVPNILPFKATKLMYNAAISPLAASAGVDNAQLLIDPLAQKCSLRFCAKIIPFCEKPDWKWQPLVRFTPTRSCEFCAHQCFQKSWASFSGRHYAEPIVQ